MSTDIKKRLSNLSARRSGRDRGIHTFDAAVASAEFSDHLVEAYQKRSQQEHTRYALGAMQEVEKSYTLNSIREAERVQGQIRERLLSEDLTCSFRLQGSVPGNIHIRGASDVDFLVLEPRFYRYAASGVLARQGYYDSPYPYSAVQTLADLRRRLERILRDAYPAADVDCGGAKAITLCGGSLQRNVDVVPAVWFDTPEYQESRDEDFRGVEILDKHVPELIGNAPFLHLRRLSERDAETWGGLKKAIRLCKTLKVDAVGEGQRIAITSYDIASALWSADVSSLRAGVVQDLSILSATTRFFVYLAGNSDYARRLQTPDGSRVVFDSQEKINSIAILADELVKLSRNVSQEQAPPGTGIMQFNDSMRTLERTQIPVYG